jgi:hypothetical protein
MLKSKALKVLKDILIYILLYDFHGIIYTLSVISIKLIMNDKSRQ